MKYLLLAYNNEAIWEREDRNAYKAESVKLCHDLHRDGKYIAASPLRSVASATSIRLRDGKTIVTDGPFAETAEQLGGYYLIEAANLDEAMDIAARIPSAKVGTIEIRPLEEVEGLPKT